MLRHTTSKAVRARMPGLAAPIKPIPLLARVSPPKMQPMWPFPSCARPIPDRLQRLNNIAVACIQRGKFLLAEKMLHCALALDKTHFLINYNLGCVYAYNDIKKSYFHFKAAYERIPSHPIAKSNYLILLHKLIKREIEQKNYVEAHCYLDEMMGTADENYEDYARVEKSRVYHKQGNLIEAERWAAIATEINPHLKALTKGPDIL
jgi:tetratricopeptide (TPR) repeat protein